MPSVIFRALGGAALGTIVMLGIFLLSGAGSLYQSSLAAWGGMIASSATMGAPTGGLSALALEIPFRRGVTIGSALCWCIVGTAVGSLLGAALCIALAPALGMDHREDALAYGAILGAAPGLLAAIALVWRRALRGPRVKSI